MSQSLRPFLAELEGRGELRRVRGPVDPVFEISAYLEELARGPAVLFEEVRGHALRVVGNVLNSRARVAAALATEDALGALVAAADDPLEPRVVADGPVQEHEVESPDLAAELPVPTFYTGETGPYVTAGAIVARHPRTGRRNWSIARVKPLGGNEALVGIAPNHHLAALARAADGPLELAVVVGNHPALLLAAAYYLRLGEDELAVAGRLLGGPVELVPCRSVGLEVPAQAEIVLEGTLDPGRLVDEVQVSEFHGLYERYGPAPVLTVSRLTRRADALFQVVQPGFNPEHVLLGAVTIAATLVRELRASVPSVRRAVVTEGGAGRLVAVVSLAEHRPGEARKAMLAAWAAVNLVRTVVVVDDDVDVDDPLAVEWAVSTRMRPERDLLLVPGVRADRADPLDEDGVVTRLGIDATRRAGDRDSVERAAPPADVVARVRAALRG